MTTLAAPLVGARSRARSAAPALVVTLAFTASATWNAVMSLWHLTPAIYTDELLYTKLAQSVAAGEWLSLRGEALVFPGLLPVLLQAPAWLLPDAGVAYAVVKVVNALVMASGAFAAYWAARALVEPRRAAWAGVLAAVSPALLYHGYLMSEAVAYPVFLIAFGTVLRALARGTLAWQAAAVLAIAVACTARVQFAALGLAYLIAAPLAGGVRRHAPALTALLACALVGTTALGPYAGAGSIDYDAGAVLRWAGWTGALLPFGVAWLLLPGALVGLAVAAARPRRAEERSFAVLVGVLVPVTLLQCGLVGAGQAFRPLERYAIYLAPVLAIAFLLWADRGAPARRAHAAVALALGAAAWLLPLPELAPNTSGYAFSFDSPSLSAYGTVAKALGHPDAASLFAGGAFLACAAVAAAGRRRVFPATAVTAAAAASLVALGASAYAGDRAMTAAAADSWGSGEWLEERADYLALPGASPHYGFMLETWNRNFGRGYRLGRGGSDFPRDGRLAFARDGRVLLDGKPAPRGAYVVNEYATAAEFSAAPGPGPRPELAMARIDESTRVVGLAEGLFFDGWSAGELRYRVWAPQGGRYRLRLELPRGARARTVRLASGPHRASVRVAPGRPAAVELAAAGPLTASVDRTDHVGADTPKPRRVGVRVVELAHLGTGGEVSAQAVPRCCR